MTVLIHGSDGEERTTSLPSVVSRDEWPARISSREKELTKARDALNADRRRLPMVRVENEYVFDGPDGKASLLDLFDGREEDSEEPAGRLTGLGVKAGSEGMRYHDEYDR